MCFSRSSAILGFGVTGCVELKTRENIGDAENTMRGVDTGVQIAAFSLIAPDPSPPQGQDDNNDDHDDNDRPDADIHG